MGRKVHTRTEHALRARGTKIHFIILKKLVVNFSIVVIFYVTRMFITFES